MKLTGALAGQPAMHFHQLSFEGPDAYARAGGLASRVVGLGRQLAALGHETHLWFVGDPALPDHDCVGLVHLHRWCQWISAYHPRGVYDGEFGKALDYAESLPPHLLELILPAVRSGTPVTVLAEEWHTVGAVLHLDDLLRRRGIRDAVRLLWNANNTFGFEHIDFTQLARAATITTVSRYMKHTMRSLGIDPLVIPNGLEPAAFAPLRPVWVRAFAAHLSPRLLLAKVARFDPDKRWIAAIDIVAALRQRGARPLLVARGGIEPHGREVRERARFHGLRIAQRASEPGALGLIAALDDVDDIDVLLLTAPLGPEARRLLFRAAAAVLANSGHEPFGLVGLEAMAAAGVACTGISGEDYAISGHNAIVLQTSAPEEAVVNIERLRARPSEEHALRRRGLATARRFAWRSVITHNLVPQIELCGT
ncbi:MAG: glycosyltransferase family 4 protein [Candidatus Rokuibacteriota bacterium]